MSPDIQPLQPVSAELQRLVDAAMAKGYKMDELMLKAIALAGSIRMQSETAKDVWRQPAEKLGYDHPETEQNFVASIARQMFLDGLVGGSLKLFTEEGTVEAMLKDVTSDLEMLRDEMREWEENTADNFSGTSKYEEVSEAADELDSACDELGGVEDLPDAVLALTVKASYQMPSRSAGRSWRASAIGSKLRAIADVIREHDRPEEADQLGEASPP